MKVQVDLPPAPRGEVCGVRGPGVDHQFTFVPGAKTKLVVEEAGEYAIIHQRVDIRVAKVGDVIEIDDWIPVQQAAPPAEPKPEPAKQVASAKRRK